MIVQNNFSPFFLSSWIILFLAGFIVVFFGKKIKRFEKWVIGIAFAFFLITIGIESGLFFQENVSPQGFLMNWLGPQDFSSSIHVGFIQDPLAFTMCGLIVFMASALLFHQIFFQKEKNLEKVFGAIAISASGICLSWCSQTPWLGVLGLGISIVGSFFSFGSRWHTNEHASLLTYLLREKVAGLILIFIGACILSATGSTLILDSQFSLFADVSLLPLTWVGSIILFFGFFIQLQSFPFIGSLVYESNFYPPIRHLLHQIFPALGIYAFLFRFYNSFFSLGVFPVFGWLAILSVFFLLLTGLFQQKWNLGLGMWIAAGFTLSLALLAFGGPQMSMALLIGTSLGGFGLSLAGSCIDPNYFVHIQIKTDKNKTILIKIALFLSVCAGTGMLGFISATGLLRWVVHSLGEPTPEAILFALVLFVFTFLGWKLAWSINKIGNEVSATWGSLLALYLIVLLSLGVFWTGSVSGEVLFELDDRIVPSIFKKIFGDFSPDTLIQQGYFFGYGVYWGLLFLSCVAAFWIAGGKEERLLVTAHRFPKITQFLSQGYRIDEMEQRFIITLQKLSSKVVEVVDDLIWKKWIPKILLYPILRMAHVAQLINYKVIYGISYSLKISVEFVARFLQMIQTGDLRWYLFISLVSGFLIIIYHMQW